MLIALSALADEAARWATQLDMPFALVSDRRAELPALLAGRDWVLWLDEAGLGLQAPGHPLPGPVRAEFLAGALGWRSQPGRGLAGELVAKACGVRQGRRPRVLDATAGLGRDGWILASLGCEVMLCERSPVVAALLASGLSRAAAVPAAAEVVGRLHLQATDALDLLQRLQGQPAAQRPDTVYLDPMFPHRDKSALVKLDMRLFRSLVGADDDADGLLPLARAVARRRVVVKRPRLAPDLAGQVPQERLLGKSSRFDLYLPA